MVQDFEINFNLFATMATIIFILIEGYKIRKNFESKKRLVVKITFFIYFLGVAYYTFFPMNISIYDSGFNFNTTPFTETIKVLNNNRGIGLYNVLGNIALLLPLGIFLPLLYKKANNIVIAGATIILSTVSIEVLQIFTSSRIGDIDDIIFNTIGGIIGFLIYKIAIKLFVKNKSIIGDVQKKQGSILKSGMIFIIPIVIIMFVFIAIVKNNQLDSVVTSIKDINSKYNVLQVSEFDENYFTLVKENNKLIIDHYKKIENNKLLTYNRYYSNEPVDYSNGFVDNFLVFIDNKLEVYIIVFGENKDGNELEVEFQRNTYYMELEKGYFIKAIKVDAYKQMSFEIKSNIK